MGGIILTLCLCLRKKGCFSAGVTAFRTWCNDYSSFAFAVSILVGLAVRLVVYSASDWYGVDDLSTQAPDYKWLWHEAVLFSQGIMPPTKSWTSIWMYGTVFRAFGNSIWMAYFLSTVLLAFGSWCGYAMIARHGMRIGAVVFAFLFFNSPVMVMHSWCVATEQIFTVFMLLALLIALTINMTRKVWHLVLLCVFLGAVMWTALWARGEGILLWLVLPLVIVGRAIVKRSWMRVVLIVVPLAIVACLGYVFANDLNQRLYGTDGVIPGNTREWNKLFGANVEHGGGYCRGDVEKMVEEYRQLHPECDWDLTEPLDGKGFSMGVGLQTGAVMPKELIPLAKRETVRRWQTMSFAEMMRLIFAKERRWAQDYRAGASGGWLKDHLQASWQGMFSGVMCLLAIWLFSRGLVRCEYSVRWLCVVCLLLVMGNMAIHVLTEAGERHAWMQYVLFPVFAAVACEVVLKEPKAKYDGEG